MTDEEALAKHPHDAFFKSAFSDPRNAALFFRQHLPPALAERIHWPSLEVLPGSFVRESLQQAHSDLLFSVKAGELPLLLYLVFEHQTAVESF